MLQTDPHGVPVDVPSFIESLKKSKLSAQCPHCGTESGLSEYLLFDGRKKFPDGAEEARLELEQKIRDNLADLKKQKKTTRTRSEKTTISVGVGKIIEKILPAHKNFHMTPADCRFLAEPIDMVVFDGLSENKINRITFMDVKTGNASLNAHQREIRDAISDQRVTWRTF